MKKTLLGLMYLFLASPLFGNGIYDAVEMVHFDAAGQFAAAGYLDQIFRKNSITTVIEIGSWAGRSTRFFGNWVGEAGVVYAIDHWKGTPNHRGEMNDPRLPDLFRLFLSNTVHAGLTNRIVPIRMSSDEAYRCLNLTADLIYIDASRERGQVYKDITNWSNRVNEGGFLCGAEFREPEVKQGVLKAARDLGARVETDKQGHFWRIVF